VVRPSDPGLLFFDINLEKYKQESNAVKELINEQNDVISDTDSILEMEHNPCILFCI
jgi:hypothetical protein